MNKIFLIIKREYLTRVRKRTFIISTILFPLLYLGLIFGIGYLGVKGKSRLKVAVIDNSGYFDKGRIERENKKDKDSSSILVLQTGNSDSLKKNFKKAGYDGYIIIPSGLSWEKGFTDSLNADRTLGMGSAAEVENKLNNIWNDIKNEKLGISDSIKNILSTSEINIVS